MNTEADQGVGLDRRELLKRGALAGGAGALMWAAPTVTRFSSPAFGSTEGTPLERGRGISYVAFNYQCGDDPTVYSMKLDFEGEGEGAHVAKCTTGSFGTPRGQNTDCEFTPSGNGDDSHCPNGNGNKVRVNFVDGRYTVTVSMPDDCILEGVAVGKCGSPASVEEPCLYVSANGDHSVTFRLCGS